MSNKQIRWVHARHSAMQLLLALAFLSAFSGLIALGIWQIERRAWKLGLIERVESRIHATPVTVPSPNEWPLITATRDEYKQLRAHGHFISGKNTRVQAVTALGAGFWLLTPFQTDEGFIVLINRGFVPPDWPLETQAPADETITGLLRLPELKGGFLRQNDPAAEHWYSRDIAAIATARDLKNVAPFFVDKQSGFVNKQSGFVDKQTSNDETNNALATFPRDGLTVIRFSNNHLGYALTWFALALMVGAAGAFIAREEYRLRQRAHKGYPEEKSRDAR